MFQVEKRSMPDMQNPNCLAGFIYFVEDAVGVFPIQKREKASEQVAQPAPAH